MKNLTNLIFAAAALVVTAGMAMAQGIKAEVPFAFRAGGKLMPAGEYRVQETNRSGGAPILNLVNVEARSSVYTLPFRSNSVAADAPKLVFECSGSACALTKLTDAHGLSYGFSHPNWGKGEDTRVAVIRAVLVK